MHILHTKQGYSWAKQPVESCARLVEGADHAADHQPKIARPH
jgi:hypothetical protein